MTTDPHEQILARLDRVIELLEDIHDARQAKDDCGVCDQRKRDEAELTEQWKNEFLQRHGLANGGIVKTPEGQPPIGRTGCSIPGHCPTHDGHVITIRDGRPVDVTEDTTRARLPEDE